MGDIEKKLRDIKETLRDTEETLRKIKEAGKYLMDASEKINETNTNIDLTSKLITFIKDLSEKRDERTPEIIDAYLSIIKTEKDISRIPWRALEYLEANHLDLYRKIQVMTPNSRT